MFDDREKNVIAANEVGIKAYVFKDISDIEDVLLYDCSYYGSTSSWNYYE